MNNQRTTETILPSADWPEGFQMLLAIVREMGTDWVVRACEEMERFDLE